MRLGSGSVKADEAERGSVQAAAAVDCLADELPATGTGFFTLNPLSDSARSSGRVYTLIHFVTSLMHLLFNNEPLAKGFPSKLEGIVLSVGAEWVSFLQHVLDALRGGEPY